MIYVERYNIYVIEQQWMSSLCEQNTDEGTDDKVRD